MEWTFSELAWLEELIDSDAAIADLQPEEVDHLLDHVLPRLAQRLLQTFDSSTDDQALLLEIADDTGFALCDSTVALLDPASEELRVDLYPAKSFAEFEAPVIWSYEFPMDAAAARRYALLLLLAAHYLGDLPERQITPVLFGSQTENRVTGDSRLFLLPNSNE